MTSFKLPRVLDESDDTAAVDVLRRYFDPDPRSKGFFTGSLFDTWDSTGTRAADVGRFTADDLVAVTLLSVNLSARGAQELLVDSADRYDSLLRQVGPDRDFALEPREPDRASPAWLLEDALRELPDVGRTIASKLLARKRPRLVPIYDSVVGNTTGTTREQWQPLYQALSADGAALHSRLVGIRDSAGLDEGVSALRVFDVLAWCQGARVSRPRGLRRG